MAKPTKPDKGDGLQPRAGQVARSESANSPNQLGEKHLDTPSSLRATVSLKAPYPQSYPGAPTDKISLQYAVIELVRQAGLKYDFKGSQVNIGELARKWVRPRIEARPLATALDGLLKPWGLTYQLTGTTVVLRLGTSRDAERALPRQKTSARMTAKWVPLFHNKALAGWHKLGSETTTWGWAAADLVAVNRGERGRGDQAAFLVSERFDYTDFHLRAEIQAKAGPNTSLAFRVDTSNEDPGGLAGYVVHIPGGSAGQETATHTVGSLGTSARLKPFHAIAEAKAVTFHRGHLLRLEIIARGSHFQVFVQGKLVVDYEDNEKRSTRGGFWLLCRPGNMIVFRKIEIKELNPLSKSSQHGP
jgi:hypothetical protein